MAHPFRILLLMLLHLVWTSLGSPNGRTGHLREHYIAAQVANWSYVSESEEPSRSSDPSQLFKKIVYTEYEADFKKEKPRNVLSGLLGPTLRCEVGDTLIINFMNRANKPLSIHPQGIVYNKQSEGALYADKTLPVEKLDDAVLPGQLYKYTWEIIEEIGPREGDSPCLTYAYYSHENMEQDFNSGLIGALLICKKGSLNEDGTQKLFDKEYVLMFAVFDESKSWNKATSLMYTINGYINGTLPAVQACAYDRISWHLIGMSSAPEIFSVHFNGQTLEQDQHKVSTVNLVAGASVTANMSVSKTGKWLISSLLQNHLQAGMHGYLNIEDCGKKDTFTKKLPYKQLRMVKNWDYFIAAEEITWDYAEEIPNSTDSKYKTQYLDNFSNLIGKRYKKAVFRQYKDGSFTKPTETIWTKERGILGPVIRATVRDTIKIIFKNMASRPYSIYVHGVTLSKEAEGAVYPSESKENSTQGKAVQPGETYTYKWTVLDTDEPTTKDAQCITRLYHSAVDISRDIASGLIGPFLICKHRALNMKGVQEKADVEQHAVFAVFDENKSWYLEDNIKQYCSNPSAVKRDDPKFYRSNVMHTLNGYAADRTDILGFCQSQTVEWHLTSIGSQDGVIPVHLSGHTFLNKGKHQDILHLFPMSGESATVTMDNVGTWLLSTWGSREMSHGMRLRFRDAKCDEDMEEDEGDYDIFVPKEPKTETKYKTNKSATEGNSASYDYDYEVIHSDDADEQDRLAAILGLRALNGSADAEEELNLTALALEKSAISFHNVSKDSVVVNTHLTFVNKSDSLHRETVRAAESSASYNQTFKADPLGTDVSTLSNNTAELLVHRDNTSVEDTSVASYSEKELKENAGGKDSWPENGERRILTEAALHALKEMCALLLYVQQKRNLSGFDNATFENTTAFLATLNADDASNLDSLSNESFSYYENENEDEEASNEFLMLSTTGNLTWDVGLRVEDNSSRSDLELPKTQQNDSLTMDSVDSTAVPKTEESLKGAPQQKRKCPLKKTGHEWNFASEKKSYDTEGEHIDKKFQNSTRNATVSPENAMLPMKIKQDTYKGNPQLELEQLERSNEQNAQDDETNGNCTVRTSGTFLKVQRKKKRLTDLTPRTSKPSMTPRGFHHAQASDKTKPILQNDTMSDLNRNQDKPVVTIGLPRGNGDYQEFDIEALYSEDSSSGSFEYEMVHYDDPYTTDSRLDISTLRNPEDIAGRYLRTIKNGNKRIYYIAAEEVTWNYASLKKGTGKSSLTKTGYKKVVFRRYQDNTFRTPEVRGEYEEHLGILGPVIRAEVDDVIQVQFKNLASRPYSLHAHGLYYEKSSEGRSYDDQSPEWFKHDDAVKPNDTYTYVWHAIGRSGPAANERICKSWTYYSAVNPGKDIQSGLIGPILICQKGMLDQYSNPVDMREFILLFMVFDEEKSWYFNKYNKKTYSEKSHHKFPAINGIPYHLEGLQMYTDEKVHWHLMNMGGPKDIHAVHFHGQTFIEQGMEDHQLGIYPLLPGTFNTVEMKPSKAGVWLLETEVSEFQKAGMQATFTVIDKACRLPLGLESGIIKDSQISASSHMGYWEPKLARLNNAGKYNAWSTENKHSWIQVDLESQVVITGIQTQGAKQLLHSLFTTEFFIAYSKDGKKWNLFKGNHTGKKKIFEGNSDASGIKENKIDPPIVARYIKVYPNKFYNRPTLRMELLGCETEDCFTPLGMESGAITNAQITASSYKKTWWSVWEPSLARLNLKGRTNAWQAKSNNNQQWLQIDLLQSKKVTGITTQGARSMSSEMYVKTFSILYSNDGLSWKSYLNTSNSMEKLFPGNINSVQQVKNYFNPPIFARFLRIIPKTWNHTITLRIELFGCDAF